MDLRLPRMLIALAVIGCAALAAVVWHSHGRAGLRRLTAGARAELRDALKDEQKVIHHYVYEQPWPYWWGYPYYGWWEDRRTVVVYPTHTSTPQPAPSRQVVVAPQQVGPQTVDVTAPGPEAAVQPRPSAVIPPQRRAPGVDDEQGPLTSVRRRIRTPL